MSNYDIAIIGLGAVGSAALYAASKLGMKVIGIDRFSPPHTFGSSHGESRIIRRVIDDDEYTALASRSYDIWSEVEEKLSAKLLHKNGCITLTHTKQADKSFFNKIESAKKYNIAYELLDTNNIHIKFPEFSNIKNIAGFYEKDAGFANPELIIKAQLDLALHNGATLYYNTNIIKIEEDLQRVSIISDNAESITANKVLLATGPWIKELIPNQIHQYFKVYRQILYWFKCKKTEYFNRDTFPVFILNLSKNEDQNSEENLIYGFPKILDDFSVKIATENFSINTEQDKLKRLVEQEKIEDFYSQYILNNFSGILSDECVRSAACSYTATPDRKFVLDFASESQKLLFVSACSGHGFKHSAAMGELAIHTLLKMPTIIDSNVFAANRFVHPGIKQR